MEQVTTPRGFQRVEHTKYCNESDPEQTRLVQQSSKVGHYDDSLARPGSSYLWVGQDHHLDREEVKELVTMMQRWLDTGDLYQEPKTSSSYTTMNITEAFNLATTQDVMIRPVGSKAYGYKCYREADKLEFVQVVYYINEVRECDITEDSENDRLHISTVMDYPEWETVTHEQLEAERPKYSGSVLGTKN